MAAQDVTKAPGGVIGRYTDESVPWWPRPVEAPPGSPNVVFIVLDDVGFAHLGCYGSSIGTPNMDRLAAGGLRYNNFHTTALCSPSRACLLTGRNHHSVGVGAVSNMESGYPNRRGGITPAAATVAQVLRTNGFSTFAVGKWHVAPVTQTSAVGPFDHWPLGKGFERFYGFLDALTDQYGPELVIDNHHVEPPDRPDYHLSEDLVDQAIAFIRQQKSLMPEKPAFLYLAFGACHAPHQSPRAFREKYRGRFDDGWDLTREAWFRRQQELGIVPLNAVLAPRNPGVAAWADLPHEQKAVACRLQEAFAAMLDHTDAQIGRLIDFLERIGELDNTLIALVSDNGASQEGGPLGSVHEPRIWSAIPADPAENFARIDEIGERDNHSNYPWGWAQAGNTPLKRYKQNTHGGGVRDPFIIHWPARITDGGAIRPQFHHMIDVVPTVLEATGIATPDVFQGVPQMPIEGTSMYYTFDDPGAATRKRTQYFEMWGHRALWHDGWKAVSYHVPGTHSASDVWELYHVDEDFSECTDLAASESEKLREMVERWWTEAGKYNVLPVQPWALGEGQRGALPGTPQARPHFRYYPGIARIPTGSAADIRNRSYTIEVSIAERTPGDEGVLLSHGLRQSGYTIYIQGNRLVYELNNLGETHVICAKQDLPAGKCLVACEFKKSGEHEGEMRLMANGILLAAARLPRTLRSAPGFTSLEIGRDGRGTVSTAYDRPFAFTGVIEHVTISLGDDLAPDPAADRRAELAAQ